MIVRENTEDLYAGLEHEVVPGVVASDGLFLDCCRTVAGEYQDVAYGEQIVDVYGDIVSDLCAGLVGGLGVVGAANLGRDASVFEAVHGSAPDIAGKNLANPTALLLAAIMMLRHIDEGRAADRIMSGLDTVLGAGRVRTRDLGGTATTLEFADAVCNAIQP